MLTNVTAEINELRPLLIVCEINELRPLLIVRHSNHSLLVNSRSTSCSLH
jgi:hypothetical protein